MFEIPYDYLEMWQETVFPQGWYKLVKDFFRFYWNMNAVRPNQRYHELSLIFQDFVEQNPTFLLFVWRLVYKFFIYMGLTYFQKYILSGRM